MKAFLRGALVILAIPIAISVGMCAEIPTGVPLPGGMMEGTAATIAAFFVIAPVTFALALVFGNLELTRYLRLRDPNDQPVTMRTKRPSTRYAGILLRVFLVVVAIPIAFDVGFFAQMPTEPRQYGGVPTIRVYPYLAWCVGAALGFAFVLLVGNRLVKRYLSN